MECDYGLMIAPLVTAIVGALTIIILGIQFHFSTRKHQVQGLLEAFKILDNEDHRKYRKIVFSTYYIIKYDLNLSFENLNIIMIFFSKS